MIYARFAAAAAAVLLIGGANSVAIAAPLEDPQCGTLPNTNWSWQKTETTSTSFGPIDFAGNSGNGFADVTTTTTLQCTAINPGGQVNEDRSTSVVLGSTTEEHVKVCSQNGEDLAGDLCTQ